MAFPELSILDSGTRADEGPPPSSAWKSTPVFAGNGGWKVVSNEIVPNGSGAQSAVWNGLFQPSMEAYLNLDVPPAQATSQSFRLYINLTEDNTSTPDGYALEFWHWSGGGTGDLSLKRLDNGTQTHLAGQTLTLAAGDQIGIRNEGGTIRSFVNGVQKNSAVDGTYLQVGGIGIAIDGGSAGSISQFGGGSGPPSISPDLSLFPKLLLNPERVPV